MDFEHRLDRRKNVSDSQEGTCEWIWEHPTFVEWKGLHHGILWIQGKPGSGKSTLSKMLTERLPFLDARARDLSGSRNAIDAKPSLVIDHFYSARQGHRRSKQQGTSHEMMLRSVIHDLLEELPCLFALIRHKFRTLDTLGSGEISWVWDDLKKVLNYICIGSELPHNLPKIIVLLDALDESNLDAAKGATGPQLLEYLDDLVQCWENARKDELPFQIGRAHV